MEPDKFLIRFIADWLVVPIVIIAALAVFRLPVKNRRREVIKGIFAGLFALLLAKVAAFFYQTGARPFEEMGLEPGAAYLNNPGFPSDHALLVFTAAFVVWAITKNRAVSLTLLALAVLVAAGRVFALVHSTTDVVGSFIIAAIAVLAFYRRSLFVIPKPVKIKK